MGDRMKLCSRCGVEFPATSEFFNRNKRNKDGLRYECKACRGEYRNVGKTELVVHLPGEVWLPVTRHIGWYEVSNLGRVRRSKPECNTFIGKILKPTVCGGGYPLVSLSIDGKSFCYRIHKIVAEAFIGPCPDDKVVNHIDGDKTNNCPENLEYITQSENIIHAVNLGSFATSRGEARRKSNLREENVRGIKALLGKHSRKSIAARFNVSKSAIDKIAQGRTWAYLED